MADGYFLGAEYKEKRPCACCGKDVDVTGSTCERCKMMLRASRSSVAPWYRRVTPRGQGVILGIIVGTLALFLCLR